MTIVLDASAAFEVAFNRPHAAPIRELLLNADRVLAPHLFINEVTNVLAKYEKGAYLDEQNAQLTLALMLQYVDEYEDSGENAVESLHESIHLKHPAYDMFYFTLARRNAATLVTMDATLAQIAKSQGVSVAQL
ncbi:MAG: type II toxin-antitoxin system VapC family toxin [Treponema sp.]|nr:type II toxin-antitoxin system VapC family toxin [Treponema sp.]